ncbi:MAG: hypothetical protein Q9225_003625 [Loekoesia sp. 1 TL-2023]
MADTLCGPSNPLQNFQKHASVDRTLERDRLVPRQSLVEGFRTPNPNAGILDAEFEAFLAGEPVADPFHPQREWQNHPPPPLHPGVPQQNSPDWALDFQNLHVHDARATPLPSAQFRDEAPLQRGPWQKEFLQRNQPQSSQHQQTRLGQGSAGFTMPASNLGVYNNGYTNSMIGQQSQNQVEASFDEEAYEKAFDAAHLELQDQQASTQQHGTVEQPQPTAVSNGVEDRVDYRIGSDRILDESLESQQRSDAQEADELARTAGHLLENVKHDQSAKFQGSNFLSLMRQLRDKEVKVEGDNIVQVGCDLHHDGRKPQL